MEWWKRWRPFHATDFQSLMYPCFTFSRILGIFPYKINASIFEASRSRYILLIIITCVICIYELVGIYDINTSNDKSIAEKIQDNCFFVLEGFIVIISFILSGPRMRLLQTILEISSNLPPKYYEKLSKLIHIKDIFGVLFLMSQTLLWITLLKEEKEKEEQEKEENVIYFYTIKIIEYYINFCILQMNMLYINCVCIVKACFKRIDDNLMNLREFMINDKSYFPKSIYYQQRNLLLLKDIKILQKQYLMVNNVVQMMNKIFSLQLLATIAITFIEITFEIYINIVKWESGWSISLTINEESSEESSEENSEEKRRENSLLLSSFSLYVLYYSIKIILIIWACETGKNQATKISTTVHDILNSISNEQIRNELHLFSLQILHCNNTFSAKGLTINATLLTVMMDTIITYLLILIQFLIISHSCDDKIAINVTQFYM